MPSVSNWFPPPSRPRPVENGLKARTVRGPIAQTWWSRRFVTVLEDIGLGGRMQRGRTYARKGQVISLEVGPGTVAALVQGSRVRPYQVSIGSVAFGEPEWARLERALAASAWYSAKLLSGEMPDDIEEVFAAQGLSLFPAAADELSMDCSCPDWEVPCKHIAAVFYLLAESFDDDPFRILAWRGREREDFLASLQAARSSGPAAAGLAAPASKPLAECLDSYFAVAGVLTPLAPASAGDAAQTDTLPDTRPATSSASVLSQLPAVDVTVRGHALADLLEPAYSAFQGEAGSGGIAAAGAGKES
jgi:uncharacterized Zn finger protein